MEDDSEESWHNASKEGWETSCEEDEDGAAAEKEEIRDGAEGRGHGGRPDRGPNRTAF